MRYNTVHQIKIMNERFFEAKTENEYTEESLKREMEEWREECIKLAKEEEDIDKEEYFRNLSESEIFSLFQRNFWGRILEVLKYFNSDGSPKFGTKEHWEKNARGRLYKDIHEILAEIGYDNDIVKNFGNNPTENSRTNGEEMEFIKKVYTKMRNLGYTHDYLMK
jgi:hypothetical protein